MDGARPSADVPPNFSTQTPAADAIPETAGDAIVAAPAPSQWQLLHQKLSLAVHLERKKISGYAEVRIRAPASGAATDTHKATDTPLLARFLLDAQCTVHKVTSTDDVELRYACFDPYNVSDIADRLARGFDLPIFAKWHAMCHRERVHQGTLWVEIPNEVGSKGEDIIVRIYYSIKNPSHGLQFLLPEEICPSRPIQFFTEANCPPQAWFPVFLSTYDLSIAAGQLLKTTWTVDILVYEISSGKPFCVACPGELTNLSDNGQRWLYVSDRKLLSSDIRLVIMTFEEGAGEYYIPKCMWQRETDDERTEEDDEEDFAEDPTDSRCIRDFLPVHQLLDNDGKWIQPQTSREGRPIPREAELDEDAGVSSTVIRVIAPGVRGLGTVQPSCGVLGKIFGFYEQYLGCIYPYRSMTVSFVEDAHSEGTCYNGCTSPFIPFGYGGPMLAVLSTHLLHDETIIDQAYLTRRQLAQMTALQWFGNYVQPAKPCDQWLLIGLSQYLAGLFLRKTWGVNDHRFTLAKNQQKLSTLCWDQAPLCNESASLVDVFDDREKDYIWLKSNLVIHALEQYTSVTILQKVLHNIVRNVANGTMQDGLSTSTFFDLVQNMSGKNLTAFARNWVYGHGMAHFVCSARMAKSQKAINITIDQTKSPASPDTFQLYVGPLTIRISEPDGVIDHVVPIEEERHTLRLPYYSNTKKNARRKKKDDMSLIAPLSEDRTPEEEEMLDYLEDLKELDDDKKELDWDDLEVGDRTIEWVRIDPNMELIRFVRMDQADYMWGMQLKQERDVVSQYEAVSALRSLPSTETSTALLKVLINPRYFFRVRMEAALAMSSCGKQDFDLIGCVQLWRTFFRRFFISLDPPVIRRNNFERIDNYFLKKTIPLALSLCRGTEKCPNDAIRFILFLIKLNDNFKNKYSDAYYMSALLQALTNCFVSQSNDGTHEEEEESKEENDKREELLRETVELLFVFMSRERNVQMSYQNVILRSCMDGLLVLMANESIPIDLRLFLSHARYGQFVKVRESAIVALATLGIKQPDVISFLLAIVEKDPQSSIRLYTAQCLAQIPLCKNLRSRSLEDWKRQLLSNNTIRDQVAFLLCTKRDMEPLVIQHLAIFAGSFTKSEEPGVKWKELTELSSQVFGTHDFQSQPRLVLKVKATESTNKRKNSLVLPQQASKRLKMADAPASAIGSEHGTNLYSNTSDASAVGVAAPTDSSTMKDSDNEKCKKILKKLMLHPSAAPFNTPVDTAEYWDYLTRVQRPMDFGTILSNLEENVYTAKKEFDRDVRQVFENCRLYNGVDHEIETLVKFLETSYENLRKKKKKGTTEVPASGGTGAEVGDEEAEPEEAIGLDLHDCRRILDALCKHANAAPFLQPVDPVALNIPTYFDEISKPMDFSTVRKKLPGTRTVAALGKYKSPIEFDHDVRLTLQNCRMFNGPGFYTDLANSVEEFYDSLWNSGKRDT